MKLVYVVRIYSKNFITDFIERLKNIVGGRLTQYEKMLKMAIGESNEEFFNKYPEAKNIRVDTEAFEGNAVMVTITGEVENDK